MATKTEGLVIKDQVYTVSQVTEIVKTALETAFPQVWVEGEVSNARKYASGHIYLHPQGRQELHPGRHLARRRRPPQVRAQGRPQGRLPRQDRRLRAARRLPARSSTGSSPRARAPSSWPSSSSRRSSRPRACSTRPASASSRSGPRRIGVVTSPTGAAIVDILRTLERRSAKLHVLIYPARVQGEGAADEIVDGHRRRSAPGPASTSSSSAAAAARSRTSGRSTRRRWPGPSPARPSRSSRPSATRSTSPSPISSPTSGPRRPRRPRRWSSRRRRPSPSASTTSAPAAGRAPALRGPGACGPSVNELAQHRIFQNFRGQAGQPGPRVDDLERRAGNVLRAERQAIAEQQGRAPSSPPSGWATSLRRTARRDHRAAWERLAAALNAQSPLDVLKKGYTLVWKRRRPAPGPPDRGRRPGRDRRRFVLQGRVQRPGRVGRPRRSSLESRFLKEGS